MSDASLVGNPVQRPLTFGRFFHTHNPFYLVSCFLIIYGLQDWAVAAVDILGRDVVAKAGRMTGGIAAYTLLMVVTCIAVVRLGKVWEDARSIVLVVIISLVALSASFDEVCISEWNPAVGFAVAGSVITLTLSELLLGCCGLRLTRWYRMALYAILAVFFAAPPMLGYAVVHRYERFANAGSAFFSLSIAAALLLLVPAVRLGDLGTRRNGTRD